MRKEAIINVLSLQIGDWVLIGDLWVEVQCLKGVHSRFEGLMVAISGHGCYMQVRINSNVNVLRNV